MNHADARTAGEIAAAIDQLEAIVAQIDVAIAEDWRVTVMRVTALAEGSALSDG